MRKGAYILSARRIGPAGKRQLDEGEGARLLDQPGRNAGGFDPNCRRNDRFALFFAQGCDMFDAVEKWNDQGVPQGVAGNAIERRSQFGRLHRDEAHIDRRAQFRGGLDARLEIAEAFASHRDPIGVKTLAGRGTGDAHHPVPLPGQQPPAIRRRRPAQHRHVHRPVVFGRVVGVGARGVIKIGIPSSIMTLTMLQIANGVCAMLIRGQIAYSVPPLVSILGSELIGPVP